MVGGAETGTRAGPRLAECGMKGAGRLTTGRPWGPTFVHRETKRAGLRVEENGAGRAAGSTLWPHTCTQINLDKRWGAKQTAQPRAPVWGNKASKL